MRKVRILTLLIGFFVYSGFLFSQNPQSQIISVKGSDAYSNTLMACSKHGLDSIIKPGMKVGILVNSDFEIKGAYVNPDVTLAVIKMCVDAGAIEVVA